MRFRTGPRAGVSPTTETTRANCTKKRDVGWSTKSCKSEINILIGADDSSIWVFSKLYHKSMETHRQTARWYDPLEACEGSFNCLPVRFSHMSSRKHNSSSWPKARSKYQVFKAENTETTDPLTLTETYSTQLVERKLATWMRPPSPNNRMLTSDTGAQGR